MANIKFSQFTVGNAPSDIDFVVGYKGADNIQISPANLLSGYLPLTGGAMSGNIIMGGNQIKFADAGRLYIGDSNDLQIYHDGTNSVINNTTGNLQIYNNADDSDISFISDDGSGGTTEYFKLDGSIASSGTVYTVFPDNSRATFGTGFDLQVYHDASNSYIKHINSATGDLIIQQERDDGDIIFNCDDGAGGTTEYFKLDGSAVFTRFSQDIRISDNIELQVGGSADLKIYHDGTNSIIENSTGILNINSGTTDTVANFNSSDPSVAVNFIASDNSMQIATSGTDGILKNNGAGSLRFFNNGGEKVRIDGSGNVGIGTTSPSAKLTVASGDVEVTLNTKGIILKSPDGTRYRITVDNSGNLVRTALP